MEKQKLARNQDIKVWSFRLAVSLILAIPLWGMLSTSKQVLGEVELGDAVELYKSHPWSMEFFRWSVIVGIIFAFTPFKRLCAMAAGIAVGSLVFYALDLYRQLEELSKMGLSEKPLMEMLTLSSHGEWLIRWSVIVVITQILTGLFFPIWQLVRGAKKSKPKL